MLKHLNVLLIDADSTIPNLALMKLSGYYKTKLWANVKLMKLNIPYYPDRTKCLWRLDTSQYDKIFCSVIFDGSLECIEGERIEFGGTGYDLKVKLPEEIENFEPDYTLYNEYFTNDTSYGFITRGCVRSCSFCKVHEKEGGIKQVNNITNIVRHSKVKFLDNNILALPNHKEILKEIGDRYILCQFNQGLDIRLIDEENSDLLCRLRYMKEYIFAFDDIKLKSLIQSKLDIMKWRRPWQFKFFVYIHPDMPLRETIDRIEWLKERECLPYIMRHVSCWDSEYNSFYVDLAAYCNQVFAFKKLSFNEFLIRRHTNQTRIKFSSKCWGV